MRPGGADSVKSQKYNPMVVCSIPAANILDILVLMYKILYKKNVKIFEKLHKKYMKRMSRHVDG